MSGKVRLDFGLNRRMPIIGMKGRINISHRFFINVYGDVGGFGAGSEFTWQALLDSGFQVSRWFALVAEPASSRAHLTAFCFIASMPNMLRSKGDSNDQPKRPR